MMGESAMTVYYWGSYVWLLTGFLVIAIPALKEFIHILRGK